MLDRLSERGLASTALNNLLASEEARCDLQRRVAVVNSEHSVITGFVGGGYQLYPHSRTASALGLDLGGKDAGLNREIVETLRAPANGSWLALARRLAEQLSKEKNPGLAGSLQQALSTKISLEGSKKGSTTPAQALERLVGFRNRLVHGERVAKIDLEEAVDLLLASVRGFGFLAEFDLLVRRDEGGFRLNGLLPEKMKKVNPALPADQPCLVSQKDPKNFLPLSPILHFQEGHDDQEVTFDELFFINAESSERLNYIAYRFTRQLDGRRIGSYEAFQDFMKQIPAPPIRKNPRIDYSELAEFHSRKPSRMSCRPCRRRWSRLSKNATS